MYTPATAAHEEEQKGGEQPGGGGQPAGAQGGGRGKKTKGGKGGGRRAGGAIENPRQFMGNVGDQLLNSWAKIDGCFELATRTRIRCICCPFDFPERQLTQVLKKHSEGTVHLRRRAARISIDSSRTALIDKLLQAVKTRHISAPNADKKVRLRALPAHTYCLDRTGVCYTLCVSYVMRTYVMRT